MGSTVTTGKRVFAMQIPEGKIGYVLCEQTYEKNCHPHTPHWSCMKIGYIEDVMKWIFLAGGACSGGMLQGRNGYLTPEGYIKGWMQELANPYEMPNWELHLRLSESPWRGEFLMSHKEDLRVVMQEKGWSDIFEAIEAGGYKVCLADAFDMLAYLLNCGKGLAHSWSVINTLPHGAPCQSLGYSPAKVKAPPLLHPVLFRNGEDFYQHVHADEFKVVGWEYQLIEHFVCEYATREMQYPGSYWSAIREYKAHCESAMPRPTAGTVIVKSTDGMSEWTQRAFEHVVNIFKRSEPEFSLSLEEVAERNQDDSEYWLTSMGANAIWRFDLGGIAGAEPQGCLI